MSKRKKSIKYSKERVLLSDTLPYETPIMFSNRYYYRFLVEHCVEFKNNAIITDSPLSGEDKKGFDNLIEILFGKELGTPNDRTMPFSYRINHKVNSFRELALIHPINQLKVVDFYNENKEQMLYYCSKSKFSIRYPFSVAKFTFFNDKLHQSLKGSKEDFLEIDGKEYENLKTFFTYKEYSNIYRFYEDYRFHRSEKKFKHLKSFDISRCFDSVYTHSITWAILGLESVKENIGASNQTFGGKFDKILQYCNYGETNGIVIGPEFSRIFAEIILQEIDVQAEVQLKEKGWVYGIDYTIFRYVDDYFLFCDDLRVEEEILTLFTHLMKPFKLGVNEQKTKSYSKPIITEITIAKDKINKLFDQNLSISIDDQNEELELNDNVFSYSDVKISISANSKKVITDYKVIIKESEVDYKDVLNYSLSILNGKIEQALTSVESFYRDNGAFLFSRNLSPENLKIKLELEKRIVRFVEHFLNFTFFIYSVSPRVNSTIKICHILSRIIRFCKIKMDSFPDGSQKLEIISSSSKNRIFKMIYDESTPILRKNAPNKYSKIESLYLLAILDDLGKNYRLSEALLSNYLGVKINEEGVPEIEMGLLNYFSITVLLYYMKNSTKYVQLKADLEDYILKYIQDCPAEKRHKSSEIVHLVVDLFFCPFVNEAFKKRVICAFRNSTSYSEVKKSIINLDSILRLKKKQKYMFTKWENVDLSKEFENKKSMEVYS